jgi:predicted RNA-binding Zn-ribbon protein involved in translation (DUF1610 family)
MEDWDDPNDPEDPDESDVCPHGHGFDEHCSVCDEEDDWDEEDETIPVCPECGSDDLDRVGEDEDGDTEWECNDCGERFSEGEED